MKSLKVQETANKPLVTYLCAHWKVYPPLGAGEDPEKLRTMRTITEDEYNRLRIWMRDCGLMEMQEGKCLGCPHRRKVAWKTQGPVLISPDGTITPVVDMATGEASPRNRPVNSLFRRPGTRGSHQPAAWVREANRDRDEDG